MYKQDFLKKVYGDTRILLGQPVEVLVKEAGVVVAANRYYISLKTSKSPTAYVAVYRKKILKIKKLKDVERK